MLRVMRELWRSLRPRVPTPSEALYEWHQTPGSEEVGAPSPLDGPTPIGGYPRTIWMTWFQGWDTAPEICQLCLASWRKHNPNWRIMLLDATNVDRYARIDIEGIRSKHVSLVNMSDVARTHLLQRHGGVWADATVFCCRPLDSWLDRAGPEGFFSFTGMNDGPSTWFIASRVENPLMRAWWEATRDYWSRHGRAQTYLWLHELFVDLMASDANLKALWDQSVERISTRETNLFMPYRIRLSLPATPAMRRHIDQARAPVYKLTLHAQGLRGLRRFGMTSLDYLNARHGLCG